VVITIAQVHAGLVAQHGMFDAHESVDDFALRPQAAAQQQEFTL